jgi:hypothetical protein
MEELLLNVKSEYDKLLQENIELKKEIFQLKLGSQTNVEETNVEEININSTSNNISINSRKEETEIINKLIIKYPELTNYQNAHKSRLFIHNKHQSVILNIITDEDDKTLYKYCYGMVRKRKGCEKCEARVFIGGYSPENMSQCDKNKVTPLYCLKHSNNLLFGNIHEENTNEWKGHKQPHAQSFIKKMDYYFKSKNNIIPKEIIYKFGSGPIRYYENGKYYHGIGINDTPKWNVNNKFDKCFFCYNLDRSLPHKHFDTYNPDIFCINCIYNDEFNKRRTKNKLYKCLGHTL